jgi:hypothetical protein
VPALSGRVLYYQLEQSADGISNWVTGTLEAVAIP